MQEMLRLHGWLEAHVPPTDGDAAVTRISHGDYRWGFGGYHARRSPATAPFHPICACVSSALVPTNPCTSLAHT